jgi:Transposase DDE domain
MVITSSGLISSLMITPAHIEEHQPVEELLKGISGIVIGDKGFISKYD